MEIYIYYAIREQDAALARQRVEALQQRIASDYGIVSRLKRRPESINATQTWMETYSAVPAGFDQVIEQVAAQNGLSALVQGERHIEYFVDLPPCV